MRGRTDGGRGLLTVFMTPDLTRASDRDTLATLFDLGRRVTSVLHLDELLPRIPELIRRLISFDAFAVYLLDDSRETLRVAWSVGYAEDTAMRARLQIGEGLVGVAVAEREPLLSNDVSRESRYVELVAGMHSEIVVPLLHQGEPIGALNILSRETNVYAEEDVPILRQFAVHVAVAIANARLFERQISDAHAFETLAEIGRDFGSILDLDELLARIGQLTRRLITYRTFGILLLDEASGELEMRLALQYGERLTLPRIKVGEGLVGYSALNKEAVNVPDVTVDPRYIKLVDDVRSELAIPMLIKDRCIGVVDLESPEFNAFGKRDVEILTLLAAQAAVAIENARRYAAVRANEERLERELRFAERVQTALLPTGLAKRQRGVEAASRFSPARELGGDFYDFLAPEPNSVVVAVGDVSGKGVPAALYSAFAGEIVRSLTFRRRYTPERATPSAVLASMNTILYERQLEGITARSSTPASTSGAARSRWPTRACRT